jgi:phosphatidylserine/phosphatidylglycerophosphate/cardiolipin synthase-like enzyme
MVKVLNATQSRGEIESILTRAKQSITIISPFIKISDELIARLADAGTRKVNITLVCREKDLKDGERQKIESVPNLKLRFNERVHSKCYFNESSMVITSLNMYDSSMGDNHEMGVLLQDEVVGDQQALQDARNEAGFIIREPTLGIAHDSTHATVQKIQTPQTNRYMPPAAFPPLYVKEPEPKKSSLGSIISSAFNSVLGTEGHCIRCGKRIEFDPERPLCGECFDSWKKFKNPKYPEEFCHSCGKPMKSTMEKPLCKPCYSKL